MKVYTRSGNGKVEKPFEKPVILPPESDEDPAKHAWADARFATDIMAEHGLFFALLMPPEAEKLGNTREVCRSSYVHPQVIEAHLDGRLQVAWGQSRQGRWLDRAESTVNRVLATSQ